MRPTIDDFQLEFGSRNIRSEKTRFWQPSIRFGAVADLGSRQTPGGVECGSSIRRAQHFHPGRSTNRSTPARNWWERSVYRRVDRVLLQNEIDVAVHSLKDLPTQVTEGLTIVPVLERADPRDVLISRGGQTLVELPRGATVGTSSYRRQSQLLALRPDLNVRPIRGNVPTRIAKLKSEPYDAVVLAAAGVGRLDCQAMITERLSLDNMLPARGRPSLPRPAGPMIWKRCPC